MLNKINVPFGYNIMQVGNMHLYTGKIRVKTDLETVNDFFSVEDRMLGVSTYYGKNNTVVITWVITSHDMHHELIKTMNRLLAHVMHKRIAYKYGEIVEPAVELEW